MNSVIQLNSKYCDNKLVRMSNEELRYLLKPSLCYRVGLIENNDKEYSFIKPSGGPNITIGTEIEGHKVKAIYKGGIIEFEP